MPCVGDEGVTRAIGEVAASLLERIVSPDDMLGLPWARTVHHAVRSLQQLPRVPVVQLSGSMISPNDSTPFDLVRYAATVSGGEGYVFQAPMIMPSADGADAVRQHEDVLRAMEAVGSVTIALCSIGSWSPGTSTIFDRLSEQDRESAREAGVVGETMGILFGEDGQTGVAQSRPADDHDQFRTAPGDTGSGRHVPRHRSASGHPRHPAERRR